MPRRGVKTEVVLLFCRYHTALCVARSGLLPTAMRKMAACLLPWIAVQFELVTGIAQFRLKTLRDPTT